MLAYSVLSLIMFVWLFIAFWRADHGGAFFVTTPVVRALSAGLMLLAFWMAAAALLRKPAVLLTAETVLQEPQAITGILRITRHPFLWALALWAGVHMLNNADPPGWLLFGYFLALALLGTLPIDARRARLIGGERWQQVLQKTSNMPFGAIMRGDQKYGLAMREIGPLVPLVAVVFWGLMLVFHEILIGLPVFY